MKVKIISIYKRQEEVHPYLENEINNFIANVDNVKDVKFQITRNFLLGSNSGEFEEIGRALISYE
jgi:hypothetical protein